MEDSGDLAEAISTVEFDAVVGFLDLAGFTASTERFGLVGARGSEALSRLINSLFTPAIAEVHAAGGEVGWFAGDAIGILFDRRVTADERAIAALTRASATLSGLTPVDTLVGPVELGVKLGIAGGLVRWNTLRVTPTLAWFSGGAVDLAAAAEHHAAAGDVIVHESVASAARSLPLAEGGDGAAFRRVELSVSAPGPVDEHPLAKRGALDHQPPRVARLARAGDVALLDQHRSGTSVFVGMPGAQIDFGMLERVAAISVDFGGVVLSASEGDKGATALAFFGAPTALADRQRRALLAACAIRAEFPTVACGVASGRVFAGRVGSATRWDYSVLGDRVNVAARLLQAAAPGEVLVDRSTLSAAGPGVDVETTRDLSLKGKSQIEPVAPVVGVADRMTDDREDGPFVGRHHELAALLAALERPGVSVLLGLPGIGKSRLLHEALDPLDATRRVRVATRESDRLRPYGLWRRLFESCGVTSARAAEPIVGPTRAPFVGVILGEQAAGAPVLDGIDEEDRAELLASAIADVVAAAGVRSLVVEDLHWADLASLDQLRRVGARFHDIGISIVVTSRPESHVRGLVDSAGVEVHEIGALGHDPVAELAATLWEEAMGAQPVPTLVEDLVERSSGSPLYCHQLISWAAVNGAAADLETLGDDVPASIDELMQARLDAVPEEAENAISYGSVLAEPFGSGDLTNAFGHRPGGQLIPGAVEILLDRQILVGYEHLRFTHSLMREVAYGRLSFEIRGELHHDALALLERAGSDDVAELARHAAETDDLDRKRQYFAAAAKQAASQFANDTARDWYRRLLPLLEPPESGLTRMALARLESIAGELGVAAVLLADAAAELTGTARETSLIELGRVEILRGQPGGFERVDGVVQRAFEHERWETARAALETAADVATMLGDSDRAEAVEKRHDELVARLGSSHPLSRPIPYLAGLLWMRGDLEQAAARYEQLYADFLEAGDLVHAGALAADLGGINYERADVAAALAWLGRGAECFERIGHERSIVRVIRGNEVSIRSDIGDHEGARSVGLAAADRALALGDLATVGEILAAVAPSARSLDEARALLETSDLCAQRLGVDAATDHIQWLRAQAHARFEQFDEALVIGGPIVDGDDVDASLELAGWRVEADPAQVSDAEALLDQLEGDRASPVALFLLADAVSRRLPSAQRLERARRLADVAGPSTIAAWVRERLAVYGGSLRVPVALGAAPDAGEVDVDALLQRVAASLAAPRQLTAYG